MIPYYGRLVTLPPLASLCAHIRVKADQFQRLGDTSHGWSRSLSGDQTNVYAEVIFASYEPYHPELATHGPIGHAW